MNEVETKAWVTKLEIHREEQHGGARFKGNSRKLLLNDAVSFKKSCRSEIKKLVDILIDFSYVTKSFFIGKLEKNFETRAKFKKSFLALKIRITPQIYIVFTMFAIFVCKKKQF